MFTHLFIMSEKLCLQWNDFQENIKGAFENMRENNDFADVTLVCEDGQQVEAHKVILAASSPFFQMLLVRNRHPHPLIYMRGMKSSDLLAIVDFLYCGEANIYQENLDSFLATAEELQLKGLVGKADGDEEIQREPVKIPVLKKVDQISKAEANMRKTFDVSKEENNEEILSKELGKVERSVAVTSHFSGDFKELNQQCYSMMEKGSALYRCKVCGKEDKDNTSMKNHIEANHLEGVSVPCNFCEKTFKSRASLKNHKGNSHKRI